MFLIQFWPRQAKHLQIFETVLQTPTRLFWLLHNVQINRILLHPIDDTESLCNVRRIHTASTTRWTLPEASNTYT